MDTSDKDVPEPVLEKNTNEGVRVLKDLRIPAALARTAFSSEQSLMAWIRTSLSLFTFGFSITQFFQYLGQKEDGVNIVGGPRRLGMALVVVGIVALLLAMVEHVHRIRKMKQEGLPPDASSYLPIGSALALLLIGIAAFTSILLKWSL